MVGPDGYGAAGARPAWLCASISVLFANLRPVKTYPALVEHAPLRAELLQNVDILFVRELVSGIYFGERQEQGEGDSSYDTMSYSRAEVEQVAAMLPFRAAQGRRKNVVLGGQSQCAGDHALVAAHSGRGA